MGDQSYPRVQALEIAEAFIEKIESVCSEVMIGGSIRRIKETVGDVEIIAQERYPGALLARLDKMVHYDADAERWLYSNGTHRWGPSYRGINWRGYKVEVFIADADNYGYQAWLRTGPGQANSWVMSKLKQRKSVVRMRSGYVWEVEYPANWTTENDSKTLVLKHKLHVPDEFTLFQLLGMNIIPPLFRSLTNYKRSGLKPLAYLEPYRVIDDRPKQSKLI